jgi:hypothetical protein
LNSATARRVVRSLPLKPIASSRPLDDRLADLERLLTRQLRDGGDTPTSKTELVELLLWELPPTPTQQLRERLNMFRLRAGRR